MKKKKIQINSTVSNQSPVTWHLSFEVSFVKIGSILQPTKIKFKKDVNKRYYMFRY